MDQILQPRPAATVLSLRDGPEGFEVLMLRRNLNSDFVGGAYVFPGGGVDEADTGPAARRLAFGLDDEKASKRLDLAAGGLAYYVACLRELFEEAGLLVACDEHGVPFRFSSHEVVHRLAAHRRAVNNSTMGFVEMMDLETMSLDMRGLAYLAHWVTPVGPPRRFDTRFFVALAPSDQTAACDEGETVADQWVRPVDALDAHARGELDMIFPTIRNLLAIAHLNTARDVLDHANALTTVPRIEPRVLERDGKIVILIPGDEGFED
jgi:8-oxo-dGTP pyrophosphatase MutT (NUDIX family)